MIDVLRTLALRLALCGCATALVWRLGAGPRIATIALYGLLLAKPLIDLASELRHQYLRLHWRDVQGRHYSFRGRSIDVQVDVDHRRWVRLADVRAAVGFTAGDAALRVTYPGAWRVFGRPPQPYLREDALVIHLAKERTPRPSNSAAGQNARSRSPGDASANDWASPSRSFAPPILRPDDARRRARAGGTCDGTRPAKLQRRMRSTSAVVE